MCDGSLHMGLLQLVTEIRLPEFDALNKLFEAVRHLREKMGPAQAFSSRGSRITIKYDLLQRRYDLLQRRAVTLARKQDFIGASRCFEAYLSHQPAAERTWISYAQMIKRKEKKTCGERFASEAVEILHRGLTHNPASARISQAWGLAELQRGNDLAAVKLLDRCVELDPTLAPIKEWQIVKEAAVRAEKLVAERRSRLE